MSFSYKIEHGDLGLDGNHLATVEGAMKLQQDLVCCILTPIGFDELHPLFGSILVENLQNTDILDLIGTKNFPRAATLVNGELRRICRNYQEQQIARNENDAISFGKYTLTPEEILVAVRSIHFRQQETHLICFLTLEIGNQEVLIPVPLSATT